jgi:hypothetical protein
VLSQGIGLRTGVYDKKAVQFKVIKDHVHGFDRARRILIRIQPAVYFFERKTFQENCQTLPLIFKDLFR